MNVIVRRPVLTLGILAALAYNVWPLGYWLNPPVANQDLISYLEAVGEPYNWLFVGGDIVSCLLIVWLVWLVLKNRRIGGRSSLIMLGGVALFGLMTAVSALLPLKCNAALYDCGYGLGETFGLHDITGALAAIGLFVAWLLSFGGLRPKRLKRWSLAAIIAWSLSGIEFLLVSLAATARHPSLTGWLIPSQQVFLILSGLGVVCIAGGLAHLGSARPNDDGRSDSAHDRPDSN